MAISDIRQGVKTTAHSTFGFFKGLVAGSTIGNSLGSFLGAAGGAALAVTGILTIGIFPAILAGVAVGAVLGVMGGGLVGSIIGAVRGRNKAKGDKVDLSQKLEGNLAPTRDVAPTPTQDYEIGSPVETLAPVTSPEVPTTSFTSKLISLKDSDRLAPAHFQTEEEGASFRNQIAKERLAKAVSISNGANR